MKLRWSDVTPKADYLNRRAFITAAAAAMATPAWALTGKPSALSTDQAPNTLEEITNYNNFYEFGTDKTDPARYAGAMVTDPWSVEIAGMVDRPGSYGVDDLAPANVLDKAGVQPGAKFVAFETLYRPEQMPGQNRPILDWPYKEGLRLDEAMHPLTILATGLYGDVLPNQNGAPIRLVVPWKYGFKSIKSIVRITLTDRQPVSTWEAMQPSEYGFYANVNPQVDHPRWSQATERRIGAGLFGGREETAMFNGYGDQVASLYAGMDLAKDY